MNVPATTRIVVATGSTGRLVVEEVIGQGYTVRALVEPATTRGFAHGVRRRHKHASQANTRTDSAHRRMRIT